MLNYSAATTLALTFAILSATSLVSAAPAADISPDVNADSGSVGDSNGSGLFYAREAHKHHAPGVKRCGGCGGWGCGGCGGGCGCGGGWGVGRPWGGFFGGGWGRGCGCSGCGGFF
ncbi:hypothetical protein H4217_005620 [Coemansia sp. RSA 1939]|nr:hypothetical protein H4217_005620 [Coemansia sp. RSA 1939]KAJ2687305.1 hypothetical protein GGH99_003290 [Coemansia sp. RSA 1285]